MASAHCQLVMPKPTFDIVADYAKARGLKVTEVPLTAELQTDIAAMQAAVAAYPGPSIVYLCNPNNPTGLLLPKAPVAQWLAKASPELQFIIDEAYGEYAGSDFQSALPFIQNGQKHTVLTKTFSKAWGMAGLRAGYAIAAPEMITAMQAQASFDNANLFALYGPVPLSLPHSNNWGSTICHSTPVLFSTASRAIMKTIASGCSRPAFWWAVPSLGLKAGIA
ncbi:MAG: hypothetical protein Sw2LagTSB_10860 [Shewanella algae]